MKRLILVAAALLIGAPALAQQTSNDTGAAVRSSGSVPEGPSQAGVAENGERRVCRRIEGTGTRMPRRRVCLTPGEWREYDRSVGS